MDIQILKNPYVNLDLPVGSVVKASCKGGCWYVDHDELKRVGCKNITPTLDYCFYGKQMKLMFNSDVTNKCCNQFGERDEIQAIIDKLRADVAERDERINALEQTLQQAVDERNGAWFEVEDLNTRLNRLREHE